MGHNYESEAAFTATRGSVKSKRNKMLRGHQRNYCSIPIIIQFYILLCHSIFAAKICMMKGNPSKYMLNMQKVL